MRVLLVSGYHGGSHQAWAEGYQRHSAHQIDLLTLPARFWKWRMHGGAVTLARRFLHRLSIGEQARPDLFLFTDMVDTTTFLALVRRSCPSTPAALYMHENQLTYPLPESPEVGPMRRQKGERDLHYAFVNFASMLSADRVCFNSDFHRRNFFEELPRYLRHFPEYNELATVAELKAKSSVLPVGVNYDCLRSARSERRPDDPPLLIWNQRWEYDKNPRQFFDVVTRLAQEGLSFRIAVCGERFARQPVAFSAAYEVLRDRIEHWGYASGQEYSRLLWQASVTLSTAVHEFFGVGILEAMFCETYAVLPERLSYPELVPADLHAACLYKSEDQLIDKLRWAFNDPLAAHKVGRRLAEGVAHYDWHVVARLYDNEFERLL